MNILGHRWILKANTLLCSKKVERMIAKLDIFRGLVRHYTNVLSCRIALIYPCISIPPVPWMTSPVKYDPRGLARKT